MGRHGCAPRDLTFHRPRADHPRPHKHLSRHTLRDDSPWKRLIITRPMGMRSGLNGGRYVPFIMARTTGGNCNECEYFGFITEGVDRVDADIRPAGRPEDPKASELIGQMGIGPARCVPAVLCK